MRTADPARAEQILQSAARLFHKRRYHEVRMDDVAADAGVAKGTLYRYFQDKEDLYLGLIVSTIERFIADVAPMLRDDQPAERRLRAYVRQSVAFCRQHPYFIDLVQRVEGAADPKRLAPLRKARERIVALVAGVIADLNECDHFHVEHPQIAALALTGMIRQVLRFLPKSLPDDLAETIADQFLFGVTRAKKNARMLDH